MSSIFKTKDKKKSPIDTRITLDAQHNEKIKYFKELQKTLPNKKKKLKHFKKELDKFKNKRLDSLTEKELDKYLDMKDNIPILEKEIEDIENNKQENEYLINTGHLLYQYYDNIDNTASGKKIIKTKKIRDNKTVIDFFQSKDNVNDNRLHENQTEEEENKCQTENVDFISRSKILDEYLSITNKNYIKNQFSFSENIDICKKCGNDSLIIVNSEGITICEKCGNQETILIDSDKPSYKDPPREICYFAYKRINHFNEWLAQFQAKESTDIPEEVYNQILIEIKKERISDMRDLNPYKLRELLKKLKLNKYYEHVPHIIYRLNGVPAPVMSRETEEKLRMMFKEIQTPFIKYCPKDRKNFLSYSYVLHKFVQLLGLDDFLNCFPLLKSREKLHQQDIIWKKICEDLKWEFIKSL